MNKSEQNAANIQQNIKVSSAKFGKSFAFTELYKIHTITQNLTKSNESQQNFMTVDNVKQ
jgi:hypothetical protein